MNPGAPEEMPSNPEPVASSSSTSACTLSSQPEWRLHHPTPTDLKTDTMVNTTFEGDSMHAL